MSSIVLGVTDKARNKTKFILTGKRHKNKQINAWEKKLTMKDKGRGSAKLKRGKTVLIKYGDLELFPKKVTFEQGLKKVQVNEKRISSRGNNEYKSVNVVKEQQRDQCDHNRRGKGRQSEGGQIL